MKVRTARSYDRNAIYNVHFSAFKEERETVAKLAVDLLSEKTSPAIMSLVAEIEKAIVGHIAFSPVSTETDQSFKGYVLTPLGVLPSHQNRKVGTQLVERGITTVSDMKADILFVYGDPKYYGRFGFSAEAAEQHRPPYKLQYPYGWQAITLNPAKTRTTPIFLSFVQSLNNPDLW